MLVSIINKKDNAAVKDVTLRMFIILYVLSGNPDPKIKGCFEGTHFCQFP